MDDEDDRVVWRPSEEQIAHANVTAFLRQIGISDYFEMIAQSAADPAWYTDQLLKFLDIRFRKPYRTVLDLQDGIEWPRWCVGGEINIIDNCLDKRMETDTADQPALIWEGENGNTRTLTYRQLNHLVNKTANALRKLGVKKGDAVGLFLPMVPEVVIALLSIAKIGAVILPLFSGYGAAAVRDRMADAKARALFTVDGGYHNGRLNPLKETADQALEPLGHVEHVIVARYAECSVTMRAGRDHWWHDLVDPQPDEAETENTSAEDLIMLIYTSGTTGKPKGTMHTHCGFPVKVTQDAAFNQDVHPGEVVYWITDMGWMMGPWIVFSTLLLGATMFIYSGSPTYPDMGRIWKMVERHRINMLGLSPTFVRAIRPHGTEPIRKYDLSSLRMFSSTGEPWTPEAWNWLFYEVGEGKRPIINYTGGTEIGGGILMDSPVLPIKPASFASPCPGIDADVYDEDGKPVRGKVGELVCKSPWIGMTRGFWNDRQRYLETYWTRWPGVWVHGDWARLDKTGTWEVLGRSDDTIKVAGKRLGPAEVEAALDGHPSVVESAAIGVPDKIKGSSVVCFAVLTDPEEGTEELQSALKQLVIERLGKPLAPREIIFIRKLPKTRNGKVMRRMIRAAHLKFDPGDTSALEDPAALADIPPISN
ncbi:MAG: AMP-binding protein [Anaerolineales bacterium]|nr:AMP-binding protein [Anaerolineales bacterium]